MNEELKKADREEFETWWKDGNASRLYGYSAYQKCKTAFFAGQDAGRADDADLIRKLQRALAYWMPSVAGQEGPYGEKASEHAMLLYGLEDTILDCAGDRIWRYLGDVNRANERLLDAIAEVGCPEDCEDAADWLVANYRQSAPLTSEGSSNESKNLVIERMAGEMLSMHREMAGLRQMLEAETRRADSAVAVSNATQDQLAEKRSNDALATCSDRPVVSDR